ncbi:MAG: GNAT family N-acetyltransferase, partial [Halobacteriaceae archaeon]
DIPRYVRLQRVQRDIPADFIDAGVQKSNLRQLARQEMDERGWECSCIRCREVGMNDVDPKDPTMETIEYEASNGTENFISVEDFDRDLLIGFCRLRFPDDPRRPELDGAALVRELHVYGSEAGIGDEGDYQHQGWGGRLIEEAERRAEAAGFDRVAVISGIGARQYYIQKLNYRQDGPYVVKDLSGDGS